VAYRIGKHEDIAAGLLRLLRSDLDTASRHLSATRRRADRIHKARRSLKRARTLLRLLDPRFGEPVAAMRHSLARSSRLLAGARDADVAAASARTLETAAANAGLGFGRAAERLRAVAAEAHERRTPIAEILDRVRSARQATDRLDTAFDGPALFTMAVARTYAKGRKALRRAETSLATPDLHRWRKSVKDIWHLLLVSRSRLAGPTKRLRAQLDALAELLGTDNDHALLAERLALSPAADPNLMGQLAAIARRRNAIEAETFALGQRIYKRKPKAFARKYKMRRG
jgi:CHAD domain-containing protein